MALLDILVYPDPRLRERAEPVAEVDDAVRRLADDMLETMYEARGIGLAATQVGDRRRVVVIDVSEERDEPRVLVNPEILEATGEASGEEGCLSIPGYYDDVARATRVRYRALERDGRVVEDEAEGTLAVCLQHEIDHLEGRLFIDYLSELKRKRVRKRMEKRERFSAAG
ncbi:MAG: peptide deformylase [Halorhodospira halophila]|uniref:peptide deformylase n=1 Tax=Halorhodospira TaxID=85108 RepID=UPI0019145161|nr:MULTISPECIES: peptide deformylase [Halorhodospira]MBK5937643.1 peptide deformylase [Halorhodospira halophila]MBK5944633.1 peptide deformylase [Halorhodospira halophila]MCC3750726.1 peptide deformylase [Halorhodospira halophila]MCG5527224.1 peptide deformylase [Halorhodospira halophila]MCG5532549.1 peptide deformylase [Halorhodospira sp. 9621]